MPAHTTNHSKLFSETGHTTNQSPDTQIPDDFTGYVVEYARDRPSNNSDSSSNFISDTLLSYTEYSTGKPDGLSINAIDSDHQKSQFFIQGHLMASSPTNFNIPKLAGYQEPDKFDSDAHSSATLEDLGINRDNLKSSLLTPTSNSSDSTIDLDQMESLISESILSGKMDLQDATHLASVLNRHIIDLSTPESYQEPDNLFQGP